MPKDQALEDVKNRFAFHPATETTGPQHDALRADCLRLATKLQKTLPDGRHKSLALTALQEAMMWGNAAIACDSPAESPAAPAPPRKTAAKKTAKKTAAKKAPARQVTRRVRHELID